MWKIYVENLCIKITRISIEISKSNKRIFYYKTGTPERKTVLSTPQRVKIHGR